MFFTARDLTCSFFFFLNDPAPPEISPLPLHAALPISPLQFRRHDPPGLLRVALLPFLRVMILPCPADHLPQHQTPGMHLPFGFSAAQAQGLQEVDRKSTRLNSSHSQISYAVFCLKKKK